MLIKGSLHDPYLVVLYAILMLSPDYLQKSASGNIYLSIYIFKYLD